eukprot:5947587-Pyramimonas_sp.AAC.1
MNTARALTCEANGKTKGRRVASLPPFGRGCKSRFRRRFGASALQLSGRARGSSNPYSHDGPIGGRTHGQIPTTDQSEAERAGIFSRRILEKRIRVRALRPTNRSAAGASVHRSEGRRRLRPPIRGPRQRMPADPSAAFVSTEHDGTI